MKRLFDDSRSCAGTRTLMKLLHKEGFKISIFRVKALMKLLGLKVKQRVAYKVTTMRKLSHAVADNLLKPRFNQLEKTKLGLMI